MEHFYIRRRLKSLALLIISLSVPALTHADSANVVHRTEKDDILIGSDGVDTIHGGAGNDRIESGQGSDTLYGGPGADTFVVTAGDSSAYDTVMDFSPVEGDEVLIDISWTEQERKKYHIPNKLTYRNVTLDRKGNLRVQLTDGKERTFLNIRESKLNLHIEDKGRMALIKFSKKF